MQKLHVLDKSCILASDADTGQLVAVHLSGFGIKKRSFACMWGNDVSCAGRRRTPVAPAPVSCHSQREVAVALAVR